jgi:putative CocE/NonD family hydrolase
MESKINVEINVEAEMRDGTVLRSDIYRPESSGPWPTLMIRTPYGKSVLVQRAFEGLEPVQAAQRGFIVVIQDTRGRFASDGEWEPFRFETPDGYDSVEWAARLPDSNGRVGLFGSSYCGYTQWAAAIGRPPSLAALSPLMTWAEPHDGVFSRGGALELGLDAPISLSNGLDWVGRLGLGADELEQRVDAIADEWDALQETGYWELPVNDLGLLRRHGIPDFGGIRAMQDPSISASSRVAGNYERIDAASLNTGGWYDLFIQGTLDNHIAMAALGRESRLLVGPWSHVEFADPIGEESFGIRSYREGLPVHPYGDWNDYQLAFMRRHLAADPGFELPAAPVRIFVMGRNEWRDEASWPLTRAEAQRWFLHSDFSLSPSPRPDSGVTEFLYDPTDPVPTVGGQTVLVAGHPPGPMDQTAIESREDVLTFTSAPLARELEVTGRIRAVLVVESSAPSTDWVARLCDVHPDGRSINLCDGIVRVDNSAQNPTHYEIDLWSTSNVFLQGHRLRVHVTSSSFPRWDRNLNTGRQDSPGHAVARQRIHHGAERPCFIELPVVPA